MGIYSPVERTVCKQLWNNVISVMIKESVVSYGSKEEKTFKSIDGWWERSDSVEELTL